MKNEIMGNYEKFRRSLYEQIFWVLNNFKGFFSELDPKKQYYAMNMRKSENIDKCLYSLVNQEWARQTIYYFATRKFSKPKKHIFSIFMGDPLEYYYLKKFKKEIPIFFKLAVRKRDFTVSHNFQQKTDKNTDIYMSNGEIISIKEEMGDF